MEVYDPRPGRFILCEIGLGCCVGRKSVYAFRFRKISYHCGKLYTIFRFSGG